MKLSRLEIFGFKSFAKKFDIRLTGGMTAIVGPNGCGKTNVVDAIRWVLGEQRPTQIRLERMEDVLFKGSENRHQLGMSEVSLTIEDVYGILPVDMPEVTITRRLFRSGESDYMINRKSCRLADINDLFMDTGMGTDSYSVFEQTMINSILSDKAEDRRHIFEEAAGITKYKVRRKSALNKLISVEEDLNRVNDIINELTRRVESLNRQAAKARRYRKLKSEVKSRTIAIASFEINKLKSKIEEHNHELKSVQSLVESEKASIAGMSADIESISVDIINVEKELEVISLQFDDNMSEITEKEKELARLDSRLESLREMTARAREAAQRNSLALEKLAGSHGDCAGNLSEVNKRLEELESAFGKTEKSYFLLQSKTAEKKDIYTNLEKKCSLAEQDISSYKTSLANVTIRRETNELRMHEICKQIEALETSLVVINENIANFHEQKLRCTSKESDLSHKLSAEKNSLDELRQEIEKLDGCIGSTREKQAAIKAERDFLAEVVRSYEGYSEGVRNAVGAKALNGRVLGVLADLVSTDDQYIQAVEAAFMESLQDIVVDTTDDALAGVQYLSDRKRGRAAFLPLDQTANVSIRDSVFQAPGVIGPAHTFVRTDDRFVPIVRRLLEGVIVVDTLDTAIKLRDRSENTKFVTLTGEIVGHYGDIHGGGVTNDMNASKLGRTERLKKLNYALNNLDEKLRAFQVTQSKLSEQDHALHNSIIKYEKELENIHNNISVISSSEAAVETKRDTTVETLENLNSENDKIKKSFEDFDFEENSINDVLSEREKVFDNLNKKLAKTVSELNMLKNESDNLRTSVNTYEVEKAKLAEKKASLTRELGSIAERREALAQSCKRTLQEIENAENESLQVGEKKKKIIEELETFAQKHEHLKNRKDNIERHYNDLRSKRSDKERNIQTLRRNLDEFSNKESSLTLERDEISLMMNNIINRLSEEYFISPEEIPPPPDDPKFDPEKDKLTLEDLRRKIHTIGDVNLAAEADYKDEKQRLDFLECERDDLIRATTTLKETISKINRIARSRFVETFDQIRINFQKMFEEFFSGGICDLRMDKDIDPLEVDIQITAKPPGKNVNSINLLSSGERALTAISLLFAIYLVKPSPFCILDEVDAPLDDRNLDRYLKVINEFSKKTQFIMVTHNKKTMAEADNLYGITMEEPGLSSLVSERLSEVNAYGSDSDNGKSAKVEETVADV